MSQRSATALDNLNGYVSFRAMDQLDTARKAIQSEIDFLAKEQKRLLSILDQLRTSPDLLSSSSPAKRGRKSSADKAAASEADLTKALEFIEAAGKGGVKAIRLASLLKKAGHSKVSKEGLLGTGRVKVTGKRGGTAYVIAG